MWWLALGIGPLVGAPVGAVVGKKTENIYYGIGAGVTASYLTNSLTIGTILRATWAGSNFIRLGTATTSIGLGTATAAAAYGYALGATVGTAASWLLFGEEGRDDAIELYTSPVTGEVSLAEWAETVSTIPSLLNEQSNANYSVPSNAASIPPGTQMENPSWYQESGHVRRYREAYESGQEMRR